MFTTLLRKYATGSGADAYVAIRQAGSYDFAAGGDWSPTAGDVKVSIDGGAQANIGTLPAYTNGAWKFVFSDAELTGKQISVMVVDSAAKAVDDVGLLIETYGNASAMHPLDLATAIADQVLDAARSDHLDADSIGEGIYDAHAHAVNRQTANKSGGTTVIYKDDGTTPLVTQTLTAGASDDEVDLIPT